MAPTASTTSSSVTDEPGYHDLRFTPVYARYETEPVSVLRSPSCTVRLDRANRVH